MVSLEEFEGMHSQIVAGLDSLYDKRRGGLTQLGKDYKELMGAADKGIEARIADEERRHKFLIEELERRFSEYISLFNRGHISLLEAAYYGDAEAMVNLEDGSKAGTNSEAQSAATIKEVAEDLYSTYAVDAAPVLPIVGTSQVKAEDEEEKPVPYRSAYEIQKEALKKELTGSFSFAYSDQEIEKLFFSNQVIKNYITKIDEQVAEILSAYQENDQGKAYKLYEGLLADMEAWKREAETERRIISGSWARGIRNAALGTRYQRDLARVRELYASVACKFVESEIFEKDMQDDGEKDSQGSLDHVVAGGIGDLKRKFEGTGNIIYGNLCSLLATENGSGELFVEPEDGQRIKKGLFARALGYCSKNISRTVRRAGLEKEWSKYTHGRTIGFNEELVRKLGMYIDMNAKSLPIIYGNEEDAASGREERNSDNTLLDSLIKLKDKLGKSPSAIDIRKASEEGFPSFSRFLRRFGSLNEAKRLAGLEINTF